MLAEIFIMGNTQSESILNNSLSLIASF